MDLRVTGIEELTLMKFVSLAARTAARVAAVAWISTAAANGDEIRVMTSGAVTPAYLKLVPEFERETRHHIVTLATATGTGPESIPNRVRRGEPVDVIILSAAGIDELIKDGHVAAGSRVDVARSGIGLAVRRGAPRPDISSVEAMKRTLIAARSIAISAQISGVYLSTDLFPRLGIAAQLAAKTRRIDGEPVGNVVARGEAEIGFQQVSELLAVPGVEYVGPLPAEVQRISVFSAGIGVNAKSAEAARAFVRRLVSPASASLLKASGLEPMTTK